MKKIIAIFFSLFFAVASTCYAQQTITKMQSLYLYNFVKNIKWKNIEDKYLIGVFADERVVAEMSHVIGIRKFNNKTIEVTKISSASEAGKYQIIFVSSKYKSTIKQLNTPTILKNTLVVSEQRDVSSGVSVAFFLEGPKLKFKINEPVCKASGLQVNATLLSLSQ